jgi:hypothetical protein
MTFNIEPCQAPEKSVDIYNTAKVIIAAMPGLMKSLLPECSEEEKYQYMTEVHTKELYKPGRQVYKMVEEGTG